MIARSQLASQVRIRISDNAIRVTPMLIFVFAWFNPRTAGSVDRRYRKL
jgi:hypothetical protein